MLLARTGILLLSLGLSLAEVAQAQVITPAPDPAHTVLSAPFQAWADGLPGGTLTAGNRFVLLENGVRSFPEKLALIASARDDVFFTTMMAAWDTTGQQMARALVAAAGRGVRVRCIIDGQRADPRFVHHVRQGGVKVALYNPWFDIGGRKHRFHQKLVVADLRAAICGGMNCTDSYNEGDGNNDKYHDTDVRIDGDAAASASLVFLDQWLELEPQDTQARDLVARSATWGPLPVTGGPTARTGCARFILQESDLGSTAIHDYYERVFQASRRQVIWHVNNVIPTPALTAALTAAAGRGVRVAVLTNSLRANMRRQGTVIGWVQYQFTRRHVRRLSGTGIEVWELDVPIHSKALTVDGVMASIGSYNFSTSSEKNLEATCVSYDPTLVTEVETMFERDLNRAHRVQ